MPELCRFFGIIITMFYDDHAPPHFHVRYGEHKAINNGNQFADAIGRPLATTGIGVGRRVGRTASGRVERRLDTR
jgi:hypothetical protein